jgi:hypothetical protein
VVVSIHRPVTRVARAVPVEAAVAQETAAER